MTKTKSFGRGHARNLNSPKRQSKSKGYSPLLISPAVIIAFCLLVVSVRSLPLLARDRISLSSSPATVNVEGVLPASESGSRTDLQAIRHQCSMPTTRYDMQTGLVHCYPASGGIWSAKLDALELRHLGINRFENSERSKDQTREDEFCYEMRHFGGVWYDIDEDHFWRNGECVDSIGPIVPALEVERLVAFPRDGIWVFDLEEYDYDSLPQHYRTAWENSLDMEERSAVLEKMGAKIISDVTYDRSFRDLLYEPRDFKRSPEFWRRMLVASVHEPVLCGNMFFE